MHAFHVFVVTSAFIVCVSGQTSGVVGAGGTVGATVGATTTPPTPRRGPQSREESPDAPKPAPASLEGKVVNRVTGAPIKRVNLTLMPTDGAGPDRTSYSATTDDTGKFRMIDIPPGRYSLRGMRTGFVTQNYKARGLMSMGAGLTLTAGQDMKEVDFKMQPHAVISGRITDQDGEPMAAVQVQALQPRFLQGRRQSLPVAGASTNDLGEYRLYGLSPGRYVISASMMNYQGMMNVVNAAPRTSQPESGYGTIYYPGAADVSGASPVQVSAGTPLTNVDIRFQPSRVVRVRGTVRNGTSGFPGQTTAVLMPTDSPFMGMNRLTSPVNRQGKFEIGQVSPGSYTLYVQSFEANKRMMARLPVEVGASDVENLDLTLESGQELQGTLKVEGAEGIVLTDIQLMVQPVTWGMGGGGMGRVKEDGTFTLNHIFPETYRAVVFGSKIPLYTKSIQFGQEVAKDNEFTVGVGAPQALSIVLSAAGGEVSGVAKGEKETPFSGATAVLIPDAPNRDRLDLYKSASTDQDGRFTIGGVAPGAYKLFVWDGVETNQWTDPDFLSTYENKGRAIKVTENGKETVDLAVLPVANQG